MTDASRAEEAFLIAVSEVNPTLDALNTAFETFSRVVKTRQSVTVRFLVGKTRQILIDFLSVTTMQMNTKNLEGLVKHLREAKLITLAVTQATVCARHQNEIRGFYTPN